MGREREVVEIIGIDDEATKTARKIVEDAGYVVELKTFPEGDLVYSHWEFGSLRFPAVVMKTGIFQGLVEIDDFFKKKGVCAR